MMASQMEIISIRNGNPSIPVPEIHILFVKGYTPGNSNVDIDGYVAKRGKKLQSYKEANNDRR